MTEQQQQEEQEESRIPGVRMVWYRKELLSMLKSVKRLKGRRVNGDSADILASAGLPRGARQLS